MKANAIEGKRESIETDYVLHILGLGVCADTLVGRTSLARWGVHVFRLYAAIYTWLHSLMLLLSVCLSDAVRKLPDESSGENEVAVHLTANIAAESLAK